MIRRTAVWVQMLCLLALALTVAQADPPRIIGPGFMKPPPVQPREIGPGQPRAVGNPPQVRLQVVAPDHSGVLRAMGDVQVNYGPAGSPPQSVKTDPTGFCALTIGVYNVPYTVTARGFGIQSGQAAITYSPALKAFSATQTIGGKAVRTTFAEGVCYQLHMPTLPKFAPPASGGGVRIYLKVVEQVLLPGIGVGPPAVAGAQVRISRGAVPVATGATGNDGSFATNPLRPGTYNLMITKAGYEGHVDRIAVGAAAVHRTIVLPRSRMAQPDPTIARLTVRTLARGPQGAVVRVAGASVQVARAGRPIVSGVTGPTGEFVCQVSPGTYTVSAARAGFQPATGMVTVPGGGIVKDLLMTSAMGGFAARTSLSVKVLHPNGLLAVGVPVKVKQGQIVVVQGATGGTGLFGAMVSQGAYQIEVGPMGNYAKSTIAVTVGAVPVSRTVTLLGFVGRLIP